MMEIRVIVSEGQKRAKEASGRRWKEIVDFGVKVAAMGINGAVEAMWDNGCPECGSPLFDNGKCSNKARH